MSRSPEVEDALKFRAHSWASEALAAEVERLEKRENELINALDMGQINCDAVYDELREEREDAKQRAEAAEAQNARLRAALERLDALYISEFDHEDRPLRPQWLQEALSGGEASK